jgi:hypothetical protein
MNTRQLDLIEITTPSYHGMTQEEAFTAFEGANPHVYENLRKLALEAHATRPAEKLGMKYLFEILRWEYLTKTDRPANEFALNNNFTAYYARLLMAREPQLRGVFELRRQSKNRLQRSGARVASC